MSGLAHERIQDSREWKDNGTLKEAIDAVTGTGLLMFAEKITPARVATVFQDTCKQKIFDRCRYLLQVKYPDLES